MQRVYMYKGVSDTSFLNESVANRKSHTVTEEASRIFTQNWNNPSFDTQRSQKSVVSSTKLQFKKLKNNRSGRGP